MKKVIQRQTHGGIEEHGVNVPVGQGGVEPRGESKQEKGLHQDEHGGLETHDPKNSAPFDAGQKANVDMGGVDMEQGKQL